MAVSLSNCLFGSLACCRPLTGLSLRDLLQSHRHPQADACMSSNMRSGVQSKKHISDKATTIAPASLFRKLQRAPPASHHSSTQLAPSLAQHKLPHSPMPSHALISAKVSVEGGHAQQDMSSQGTGTAAGSPRTEISCTVEWDCARPHEAVFCTQPVQTMLTVDNAHPKSTPQAHHVTEDAEGTKVLEPTQAPSLVHRHDVVSMPCIALHRILHHPIQVRLGPMLPKAGCKCEK